MDYLLFTGNRLIIPSSMRQEYLERIHISHLGQTKCQLRAKECLYWPNITSDIDKMVKDCVICLQNARSNKTEPMIADEAPFQPWEIVHSDLFDLDGHKYILTVDQYSKMPLVRALRNETSAETIKFCKDMFAVHGIPKRFCTDNGPQYRAAEFRNFALAWDFEHVTSSPRYAQSNGFIESMVGYVKPVLRKAKQSRTDPQLALLCLRGTPIDSHLPSPAELLYGKRIRTNLPVKNECKTSHMEARERLIQRSDQGSTQYNSSSGPELSELLPGMKVLVQSDNKSQWVPGVVQSKCKEPRSYIIQSPNGSLLCRNRRFIQEISPQAARKLAFDTPILPQESKSKDLDNQNQNVSKATPKKKSVHFSDQSSSDNCPVTNISQPLRSSNRVRSKTKRYIEQCGVLKIYGF